MVLTTQQMPRDETHRYFYGLAQMWGKKWEGSEWALKVVTIQTSQMESDSL